MSKREQCPSCCCEDCECGCFKWYKLGRQESEGVVVEIWPDSINGRQTLHDNNGAELIIADGLYRLTRIKEGGIWSPNTK